MAEVARPPVAASAGAPALAGSPSIRAFVAKSVLTRITRYWIHYFQLFSATSTVKMPVFMKNYKFCWQNCKKNDVYVAKICNGKIRCFCRKISFVAIYTLLDVPFSAIHGDEWLFHDYNASGGLPMLAQGCHTSAGFIMPAQGF